MLCLSGFELYSRWVPLLVLFGCYHVATWTLKGIINLGKTTHQRPFIMISNNFIRIYVWEDFCKYTCLHLYQSKCWSYINVKSCSFISKQGFRILGGFNIIVSCILLAAVSARWPKHVQIHVHTQAKGCLLDVRTCKNHLAWQLNRGQFILINGDNFQDYSSDCCSTQVRL